MSEDPTMAGRGTDDDPITQERLRRALAARAELVNQQNLSVPRPPAAPGGHSRTPWYVTGIAVAAAAAAVGVLVVGGWSPFGTGGGTTVAGQPTVTASAGATTSTTSTTSATGAAAGSDQTGSAGAGSGSPGASASGAGATGASPSAAVAVCAPAGVTAFVLPDTATRAHGGGMNHQGATIGVTNVGSAPCRLYGYLGVGMYQGDTLVSEPTAVRGDTGYAKDPGPTSIVLASGRSAYTELAWSSADGVQPAVTFTQIRVILPDQRTQLTINYSAVLGGQLRQLRQTALTAAPAPI